MNRRGTILALVAGVVAFGGGPTLAANPSDPVPDANTAVSPLLAAPTLPTPAARRAPPTGNPLWGVPLSTLSATRERPLFSPSRRPPAPVIASPSPIEPQAPAPPAGPGRPALTFIGSVTGESEGLAVFLDGSTQSVVRLRTGQDVGGWVLTSVKGREATLEKAGETAVFALPAPSDTTTTVASPLPAPSPETPPPVAAAPIPDGTLVMPGPNANFAPFIPRRAPKDGTPDGL